ncbi:hypothetical protein TSUD_282380 [Trifolium subterraneum]|uniref:Uncharacterized protein n=1 Tax=Trifolium subterraneum TaxID=3900 RepID=A0A2Z6NYX9_TRISU|nr:hypothetical protein TSUD_282380 [Trifolium subterraneum]
MDIDDLLDREGDTVALDSYFLKRMRSISNEERLAFIARACQKKLQPKDVIEPLSQLYVEDDKEKKRKKKTKTERVTMEIPNKGNSMNVEHAAEEVIQGDGEDDDGLGFLEPNLPPTTSKATSLQAANSLWDSSLDPLTFKEGQLPLIGDSARFADTTSEDLHRLDLEHGLKGVFLNYLLSCRQEHEVLGANKKMKVIDEELADIQKMYSSVKDKLRKEIEDLKTKREKDLADLKKECEAAIEKLKE